MRLTFLDTLIYRHPVNPFKHEVIDRQMLYLASPVLLEEQLKGSENEKTTLSLKKYQQRASTRCTPFGLFAGCGTAMWAPQSSIEKQATSRHTRLDMNVVCEIAALLASHPVIKTQLTYYTNNSLYKVADKYRYVEYTLKNKSRHYQITSIDVAEHISDLLSLTAKGANYGSLISCLLNHTGSSEEAESFVNELIEAQVITTNLYPNVTGTEFYTIILNTLKDIAENTRSAEIENIYRLLAEIDADIKTIDRHFDAEVETYRFIYAKLQQLLQHLTEENLFQADLYYQTDTATVNTTIQSQLSDAISFLDKLYHDYEPENLKKFKENFQNQYEEQELPLLQVLDTASGIGYLRKDTTGINPIVDDIYASGEAESVFDIKWSSTSSLLLKKIIHAKVNNLTEIQLTDEDLKNRKETAKTTLPPSMPVFFTVVHNTRNTVYLKQAGGSSASNLLGRFAHGNSEISGIIDRVTEHEINFHAGKIMAEIVHLPESRVGNILLRPHIHQYEIAYLANSTKEKEQIIDPNDLLISVKNNKIILRSRTHQKEIIPRLTSAHNFSMSTLPVYQFLCDIQSQYYSKSGFSFNWGHLAGEFGFLPRVCYKNTILSPAQWNIGKEKVEEISDCLKQYEQSKIKAWQNSLHLPDRFLLSDGDNELFVDTSDMLSVKAFASAIKKRDRAVLHESLFDEKDPLITDRNGNSYTNELIGILLNHEIPDQPALPAYTDSTTRRSFATGSEWLYYKIYGTPKILEDLLAESFFPLIKDFSENQYTSKWFFIRYADPDNHLRLRFRVTDTGHLAVIQSRLNQLFEALLKNRLIEKVQTDTYNRELERYGFSNVDDTESLFDIDSSNCLDLVSELNHDEEGDLIRLKYACLSAYRLMQHFELDEKNRALLISHSQKGYFNEHGGKKELKLLLDDKYRRYRKSVETILAQDPTEEWSEENLFIIDTLSKREHQQKKIINAILEKHKANTLKVDLNAYIQSLIHMHVNRLFRGKQRTYELLVYDFLQRGLKSIEARKLKSVHKSSPLI